MRNTTRNVTGTQNQQRDRRPAAMKRVALFTLLAASLLAVLALGACEPESGSGNVQTETRSLSGFDQITFDSIGTLSVKQTGTESLSITAEDNVLPALTSEVTDRHLVLGTVESSNIAPTKPISYVVTVKTLKGIELASAGSVIGQDLNTGALQITLRGLGGITLSGKTQQQSVTLSGAGSYDGAQLASDVATIDLTGTGDAVVAVRQTLNVHLAGHGSVEYIGSPSVTKTGDGDGTVHQRGA